jgi:hypothetical protein
MVETHKYQKKVSAQPVPPIGKKMGPPRCILSCLIGCMKILTSNSFLILHNQQGVCHTGALPFTLKSIFKAKEKFRHAKNNLQKIL